MTTKLMTPVSIQIPITDAAGKPTPAFHRWLQQLSVGSLLSKTNGTVDVNSTATSTAKGVLTYFDGGGPYAWPSSSARVSFSRFLMENPDGSFVGMGGTAAAGSQMFGATSPSFTHWWNFAQISGSKYLIDGDMSYSFTLDAYVNANKIYHQGNLSFGTGLTYNAGTGVLTASGGGSGINTLGRPDLSVTQTPGVNFYLMKLVIADNAFTIGKVAFAMATASATSKLQVFVYASAADGTPGTLLGSSVQQTGVVAGYNEIALSSTVAVTKGQMFWVGASVITAALTNMWAQSGGVAAFAANGSSTVPAGTCPTVTRTTTANSIYAFWAVA